MRQPAVERYAGWVWQTVTGVDLISAGLSRADPEAEGEADTVDAVGPDSDQALPLPDVDAIARYPVGSLESGRRYCAGRDLDVDRALNLLMHAPQAVRSIAAGYLRVSHRMHVHVRSCGLTQGAALAELLNKEKTR